jgi:hypothetical protein
MIEKEDEAPFDLRKALASQEDTWLEIKDRELPTSIMASLSGMTVQRHVRFSGVTFPACESWAGDLVFSRVIFKRGVYFENCTFLSRYLSFSGCMFEGGLCFFGCKTMPEIMFWNNVTVRENVLIRQCTFDRLHILPGNGKNQLVFDGRVDIEECSLKELSVLGANCYGPWYIRDSSFERKLGFSDCTFASWLNMEKVIIKGLPPREPTSLDDGLRIGNCALKTSLVFKNVTCDGNFTLFNSVVDGSLQLFETSLNGNVFFASVDKGPRGECDIGKDIKALQPGALEPLYRYAKVAKASRGDLDAAGQFYYLERKARNAAARAKARWRCKPWSSDSKVRTNVVGLLGEWLLGYGEKPERPLIWAAATIVLFAVLFWLFDAITPHPSSILDYGNMSVFTFTTLGYSDMRPVHGLPFTLAAVEAILGCIFMPLFLVTLARKFMR